MGASGMQQEIQKWQDYIAQFNENDEEIYATHIPNEQALAFLEKEIPIIDLPDKVIERAYYFRWWVYRKHVRKTPEGHVITEFLPDVPWGTTYNAIICASGFHIREGRWLKDTEGIIKDYIRFWLTFPENTFRYTTWLARATEEYCEIHGDWKFAEEIFQDLETYLEKRIEYSKTESGLYYSKDGADGMELGISGSGLRPTVNSYVYADAKALARLAKRQGLKEKEEKYLKIADDVKAKMMELLWDKDFFRTIPEENMNDCKDGRPAISPERTVKELLGYVPWYFHIPEAEQTSAFQYLLSEEDFSAPFGLTTAERSHPIYFRQYNHQCAWNGPVWPFATTQVLVALANALRDTPNMCLGKEDYYALLHQYAASFRRTLPDGRVVDWMDENMDPHNGEWLARRILESWEWPEVKGGYERGKDYNHSMFCDLVLSGLLGIDGDGEGELSVNPLIPNDWEYFRVQNLHYCGEQYEIIYDKNGTHYGEGIGLQIKKVE